MKLSELSPAEGSVRQAYRKGRGAGSGECRNGQHHQFFHGYSVLV